MRFDDSDGFEQPPVPQQASVPSSDDAIVSAETSGDAGDPASTAEEIARRQRRRRILIQISLTLAGMVLAFAGGWFSHQAYTTSLFSSSNQSQKYAALFQQAWNIVDQNYVGRSSINYQKMSYDAIRAMLVDLGDPGHTRFLTPQDVKTEQQQLSGTFAGIGIYIQQDPKTKDISIISTIDGAPAQKAGLQRGDILLSVNGKNVVGLDVNALQPLIQGPAGTKVTITVRRPSTGQVLTFTITRAVIKVPNVTMHYIPENHIAHIQIVQFASGVSDQLKAAILQAKKEGATKIILDLRNNPGGYLQEAIDTASEFMGSGTVLIEQNSSGQQTKYQVDPHRLVDAGIPMIVLVNGNTASAAEIVSGALQDNNRALIMGTKTFGTGTVLQEFDLSDGSAILLGTSEWLTPKGHFIRTDKITPNIVVPLPANGTILTPDVENQGHMSLAQIMQSGDAQLIAAIKYLESH